MVSRFCSQCAEPLQENASYCSACAAPVGESPTQAKKSGMSDFEKGGIVVLIVLVIIALILGVVIAGMR